MPVIVIDHLTKAYGENGIFNLSLRVENGQSYGLIGPAEAGKSTVASLLMGFQKPDEGKCTISGMDCFSDRRKVQSLVGFVPGYPALPLDLTCQAFFKLLERKASMDAVNRLHLSLEAMDARALGPIRKLDRARTQMIMLAVALMKDAPVLLLDNPTNGLNALQADRMLELIRNEKKRGKTILLFSHVLHHAQSVCDTVAIMRKGRLVVEQSPESYSLTRQKVYHITFDTVKEAMEFETEWRDGVERLKNRAIVALSGSPKTLLSTLSRYEVVDLVGGRESTEESYLRDYGDDAL